MKSIAAVLIALLTYCVTAPASALINGHIYIPIADWAHNNGFSVSWLRRGDELQLTSASSRLVFDVNSRTAEINGVNVALSFPVANVKRTPLIAQMDLDTAVRPLIFPPKFAAKKITTICIDPGHGGKDTGNRVGHIFAKNEKTYTLALAQELAGQLRAAGFNVILTRNSDTFVELPVRPDIANRRGADLFISLHFNATESGKDDVSGPETYCITPVGASSTNARGEGANYGGTIANRSEQKSLLLAYQIQKSLVRSLNAQDRSVRRARFAVLRDAQMPAVLVEGGYMTHPVEGRKIFDAGYRQQMAAAIVRGVVNYQKLMSPAPASATVPVKSSSPKRQRKSH